MSKPRLCAKLPKPRRMGCAPDGVKVTRIEGEMSFVEFLLMMSRADKEQEKEPTSGQLAWAEIMRQTNGGQT